jgi:membrane protein required for colicin V production
LTLFDAIAVLILAVSALVGVVRGALREVTTVIAFVIAVFAAAFALRFTGPLARAAVHPSWAANAVALLVVFLAAYIALRVIAAGLTRSVHNTRALGTLDRTIGGAFGLARGLIVLGVFYLVFNAATPPERVPTWISHAAFYPLSRACAEVLRTFAPQGSAVVKHLKPAMENAVRSGGSDEAASSDSGQSAGKGYSDAARKALDDVVEKSR